MFVGVLGIELSLYVLASYIWNCVLILSMFIRQMHPNKLSHLTLYRHKFDDICHYDTSIGYDCKEATIVVQETSNESISNEV